MTIRETLAEGKRLFESPSPLSFIDTPALDAALLLGEVMCKSRTELIVHDNDPLGEAERENFFRLLERRKNGECVAYILGRREFRGLEFTVNPNVLVPRPDTETLVEAALEYIDTIQNSSHKEHEGTKRDAEFANYAHTSVPPCLRESSFRLLDLCTGSGALVISLKNERPFLDVTASDISSGALETAALNAARLLDTGFNTVRFIHSDLFENIHGKFDIIVSNPPYIPSSELSGLAPEVRGEPQLALDGGGDGLELIRKIISRAGEYLFPGGIILLEASPEQMPVIMRLLETHGFGEARIFRDLTDRDRVIAASAGIQAARFRTDFSPGNQ